MLLLLLMACRSGDPPSTEPAVAAGVLRLGPPAPTVGAYGIAAPPGRGEVYVSNLHVPFLTIVDAATGAWAGALDLREGCAQNPFFPRLFVHDDVLWVTDLADRRLCRDDLAAEAWLPVVDVAEMGDGVAATDEGIWVTTRGAVLRHDGTGFVETVPVDAWASGLAVEGDAVAVLVDAERRVLLYDRDGTLRWEARADDVTLQDVALVGERVYVTERETGDVVAFEGGAEVGRVHTGSDTFAIEHIGDALYVTNRQGAELPASGAYEGAPGVVTALALDLSVRWSVELSKTIHFLAWDGERLWTANEDALRVSAIDPEAGAEVLRGEPIGLTLDHVTVEDGRLFFGSHLTDELWRADPVAREADAVEVCGWPFLTVPTDAGLVVPCEESGSVWTVAPDTFAVTDRQEVADSFFAPCADGLCTGHDVLVGAARDGDTVVFTDASAGAVRWTDGRAVVVGVPPGRAEDVHHFDVAPLDGAVLAFEPRSSTVYALRDGAIVASHAVTDETATFTLVPDGDRVWAGAGALDATLAEVARLPTGVVQMAGEGWIVVLEGDDLVVRDEALAEAGRLSVYDLRVPPFVEATGKPGALRFRVADGELWVANTMRGTVERRGLPALEPLGDDTVVPVGRWEEWEGLL